MKTKQFILTALASVALAGMGTGAARGVTNEVSALLQKGLFEEEANHNLEAAIQAYQAVVTQTEKDRQFAATAIFRLGECYRKLGRTNEANVQYQRIVKEFSDQTELAKLSQSYVGSLPPTASTPLPEVRVQMQLQDIAGADPEAAELERIKAMIKDSPDLINGRPNDFSPLFRAAEANNLKVARFLIDNKADVNAEHDGTTPVIVAAERGHKEMVELLAGHGANLNVVERANDAAPLHFAAKNGSKAIAEVLLAHKADVNVKNRAGRTPLHLAAENGFLSFAELLLANGANVNAADDSGETPLFYAAKADNRAIMELLLAHKAEVDAKDRDGATPLIAAAEVSRLNAARFLIANGAEVNAKITGRPMSSFGQIGQSLDGWTALHCAVAAGQPEMVKLLLENKADPNLKARYYYSPRGTGGLGNRPPAFPAGMPGVRATPAVAIQNPCEEVTPLAMAVLSDQKQIAELLLDHRADINAQDKNSDTLLSLAVTLNLQELAEFLLAHGATVQSLNNDHLSPLSIAVKNGSADLVKLLLGHKPELEVTDKDDFTPLQRAVLNNDTNVAGLLLDAGAFVDARYNGKNYDGESPLAWAASGRRKEMAELLLAYHANPNFQNNYGDTPLYMAKSHMRDFTPGNPGEAEKWGEIAELLEKAGANENLQRLTRIGVSRGGSGLGDAIFFKGTNLYNHFTLFDLLSDFYGPPGWTPNGIIRNSGRVGRIGGGRGGGGTRIDKLPGNPFPDFSKIKIGRLGANGKTNLISVDLGTVPGSGDCSKNVSLQWGDIVEIPEADHNVNEVWLGLADPVQQMLKSCLGGHVAIVVKGRTNEATLAPYFFALNTIMVIPETVGQNPRWMSALANGVIPPKPEIVSFWLYDVVQAADVLLTSSDLSRVKVRRVDPTSRKTVEMIFNLEKDDPQNKLWLRDGDVIEVPEKM
jgi:ankyrin repeat protein